MPRSPSAACFGFETFFLYSLAFFFKNNANSLFALVLDDDDEERMLAKHHNAGKNERRV
jgi:hypothetical protein